MRRLNKFNPRGRSAGFSITELLVVISIMLVVGAISVPSVISTVANYRFISNAQDLAAFYQRGRMQAITDNNYYNVQVVSGSNPPLIFIDLNGDGTRQSSEPQLQLATPVSLDNSGAPSGLDSTALGFSPLQVESSTMYTQNNQNHPGIAFNSRGLPCQRVSTTSLCTNAGWVQYLQYNLVGGGVRWGAVVITPASRIKVYKYNGTGWF